MIGAARIHILYLQIKSHYVPEYRQVEIIGKLNQSSLVIYETSIGELKGTKCFIFNRPEIKPNSIVKCTGKLTRLKQSGDRFSYIRDYYNKIIGYLNIDSYSVISEDPGNLIQLKIRQIISDKFQQPARGFLFSMVLGDSSEISQDLYSTMTILGISHLLVVSAMHFVLFGGVFYLFFRWILGIIFLPKHIPMHIFGQVGFFIGSCIYFILVNHSWSVIRAFSSTLIMLGLILFNRRSSAFQNLTITLLLMLLIYPEAVFDTGFQLSFISVFTLILFKSKSLNNNSKYR
jgi:ComEC/Rec2-related protein